MEREIMDTNDEQRSQAKDMSWLLMVWALQQQSNQCSSFGLAHADWYRLIPSVNLMTAVILSFPW